MTTRTSLRLRELVLPLLVAATVWLSMLSWTSFTTGTAHALNPLAGVGLAVALLGFVLRRLRVHAAVVVLAQLALAWIVVSLGLFHSVAPVAGASRAHLLTVLNHAYDTVADSRPPVPVPHGVEPYLLLGGAAAFVLADALACSLRRVAIAGFVPLLALALTLSMSSDSHSGGVSWWVFVLVAGGYLAQLLVQEWDRTQRWGRSVEADDRRAVRSKSRSRTVAVNGVAGAVAIGAAATALSLAAPAVVPVAHLDLKGFGPGDSGHKITVTNPLVDLHRDLTQGANVPLLTVTSYSGAPSYFRIAALTEFDDTEWTAGDRAIPKDQNASGAVLPQQGVPSNVPRHELSYSVQVSKDFDSKWLPTPAPAHSVQADGDWRYDTNTMDFLASSPGLSTAGMTYSTSAEIFDFKKTDLEDATMPTNLVSPRFTALPSSIPQSIDTLATQIVSSAGATTPFADAIALQRFFRTTGHFTYSTKVSFGTGVDDLARFLNADGGRKGYCQQFAASMAVMARILGIPSRVAVGFLNAKQTGPHTYVFSSHDMHAWPELYFAGTGWVRFEPTPAARAPQVPDYTLATITSPDNSDGSPSSGPSEAQSETPSKGASQQPHPNDNTDVPDAVASSGHGLVWIVALVVLLLVVVLLALPSQIRSRRRARRLQGSAEDGWAELHDTMIDLGLQWPDARSPRETATRVADYVRAPDARQALIRLTTAVEIERYAASPPEEPVASDVLTIADELNQHVSRGTSRTAKLFPRTTLRR